MKQVEAKPTAMKQKPRPRTKPPEVRREEIMDAAERLFLAQGVASTTIDHIAAGAEPLVGAGEADGVEFGLLVGPDGGSLEAAIHVLGVGIAPLGPVNPQVKDAPADLGEEETAPEVGRRDDRNHRIVWTGGIGHAMP